MIIHKCDKCGKLSEQKITEIANVPTDWVSLNVGKEYYSNVRAYYEICAECADALKIPTEYRERVKDIGERLIEILTGIIGDEVQAQIES